MPDAKHTRENTRSSIFERVPPDLRRQVDIAIIERVPPTYAAVWMQFELAEHRVSYNAFLRYARRLRDRANLAEIANLTADDDNEIDVCIRKLVTRKVFEALLNDDELPPDELAKLTTALRQIARTALQERKAAEDSRIAWARIDHDREHLRLKAEHIQAIRQRFIGLLEKSPAPLPAPDSGHENNGRVVAEITADRR